MRIGVVFSLNDGFKRLLRKNPYGTELMMIILFIDYSIIYMRIGVVFSLNDGFKRLLRKNPYGTELMMIILFIDYSYGKIDPTVNFFLYKN